LAAHLGLPYAFAWFITDGQGVEQALQIYRETFKPSARLDKPLATVCVWALAAETDAQAWHLFESRARWRMDRNIGRIGPMLPPEQALREYSAQEHMALKAMKANALVGSAKTVAHKLQDLADRLGLEELVVITWTHDPQAQVHSYSLLAQEFNLKP